MTSIVSCMTLGRPTPLALLFHRLNFHRLNTTP